MKSAVAYCPVGRDEMLRTFRQLRLGADGRILQCACGGKRWLPHQLWDRDKAKRLFLLGHKDCPREGV